MTKHKQFSMQCCWPTDEMIFGGGGVGTHKLWIKIPFTAPQNDPITASSVTTLCRLNVADNEASIILLSNYQQSARRGPPSYIYNEMIPIVGCHHKTFALLAARVVAGSESLKMTSVAVFKEKNCCHPRGTSTHFITYKDNLR